MGSPFLMHMVVLRQAKNRRISFPYGFYFNGIRKSSGKPVGFSDAIEVKTIGKTDRLFPALCFHLPCNPPPYLLEVLTKEAILSLDLKDIDQNSLLLHRRYFVLLHDLVFGGLSVLSKEYYQLTGIKTRLW